MTKTEALKTLRKAPEAREILVRDMAVDTRRDEHGKVLQTQCPLCTLGFATREIEGLTGVLRLHLTEDH